MEDLRRRAVGESLAYAASPGLVSFDAESVTLEEGARNTPPPRRGFYAVALAIRPLVAAGLDNPRSVDFDSVLDAICTGWKAYASAPPPAGPKELTTLTIGSVCWTGTPCVPTWMSGAGARTPELMVVYDEWVPGRDYNQAREFEARAGHDFVLKAAGHPDVHVSLDGGKFSDGRGRFQAFGLKIAEADRAVFAAGVDYRLEPVNTSDVYRWVVKSDVVVRKP